MCSRWCRRGRGGAEDLTFDKIDDKDAVLIARLTAQLRCYVPEPVDETWTRLRHLGGRRERLVTEITAQVQQVRDLLECVWPAALETAAQPLKSRTWAAALTVVLDRDGGDLARTRRLGLARFEAQVRREVLRWGATKPCLRIARKLFAALADGAGVLAHRRGALERVALLLEDWHEARRRVREASTGTYLRGEADADAYQDRTPTSRLRPLLSGRVHSSTASRPRLQRDPVQGLRGPFTLLSPSEAFMGGSKVLSVEKIESESLRPAPMWPPARDHRDPEDGAS